MQLSVPRTANCQGGTLANSVKRKAGNAPALLKSHVENILVQAARPQLTKNGSTPGGKPEAGKSVSRMPVILQVNSSGPPQRAGHTVTRHIARVASSTCHAVGPPSQHCHQAYWSGSEQSRANVATFPRMKTLQENKHACSCFASLVGCTNEKEGASQL